MDYKFKRAGLIDHIIDLMAIMDKTKVIWAYRLRLNLLSFTELEKEFQILESIYFLKIDVNSINRNY